MVSAEFDTGNDRCRNSRERLHEQIIADCKTASSLVDGRCSEGDATAYKSWVIEIARDVAHAAREGGFLGFGGTQFSPEEQVMLARIEAALGAESGVLIA